MQKKSLFGMTLLALFFVIFIDGIGQGLIFPILANTLIKSGSHVLLTHASLATRNLYYGLSVGVFFLFWFIGAPILSDLSDTIGRKQALMFCLLGSAVGFILTALAFIVHSVWLIILGRIIDGFTAGSQPIAQATIVDICDPKKKAKYLGMVLLAAGIGIVLGPLMGSIFSDANLVSWFTNATPLYLATILAILNLSLLQLFFTETKEKLARFKLNLARASKVFISGFKIPRVRSLTWVLLPNNLGWAGYWTFGSAYLAQHYKLSHLQNGMFMLLVGIAITIGLWLCGIVEKRYKAKHAITLGIVILAISIGLTVLVDNLYFAWAMILPAGICNLMAYALLLKLYSEEVVAERQGWVMGFTNGIVAGTTGIMALISGILANISVNMPLMVCVVVLMIAVFNMARWKTEDGRQKS